MIYDSRRRFLKQLATVTGSVVLVPVVTACGRAGGAHVPATPAEPATLPAPTFSVPPLVRPADWDPIVFNRIRGNAGAIPESYWPSINGPNSVTKHLGKHLPYRPEVDVNLVPEGYLALMWGDASKGYARHPNVLRSESNAMQGHWYNWIRIRKADQGEAEELESRYSEWPSTVEGDNGAYAVFGEGEITADSGRNTIYLAALPTGLSSGDEVRVHAHCLTHGEYVDFISI